MIDPQKVISRWPQSLDTNGLSDPQNDGVQALVDEFNIYGDGDYRKLAYILATAWHETAKTMQPIEEWGKGTNKPYGKLDQATGQGYWGRGHVQLTWKENYERFGKMLGIDLVNHPQNALDMTTSAKIASIGMMKGLFTGKKLGDYFTKTKTDWVNARRIINGVDRAKMIAGYAIAVHSELIT